MAFTPQNFVDKVGPAISSAFLNALDNIQGYYTVTSNGIGTLGPPVVDGATLTIVGGANGAASPPLVLTSTGTTHFQIAGNGVALTAALDLAQLPDGTVVIQNLSNNTIQFKVATLLSLQIDGTQIVQAWEKTNNVAAAGLQPVATEESGSFTGTLNNVTGGPITATLFWRRVGPLVFLTLAVNMIGGSNNTTAPTITGLPAALVPAPAIGARGGALIQDNTINEAGYITIAGASQTINLLRANGTGTFTNAGNKGTGAFTLVYSLT